MGTNHHGMGAHERGRCPVCAGIVAAARAAREAVQRTRTGGRGESSVARRIWAAAREGRLELVAASSGATGPRERQA